MKERPILFSGPMVRAILRGRKTQTRRIANPDEIEVNIVRPVRGDWPIGHHLMAECGPHLAQLHQYGAVSVLLGDELLGLKPGEFEWLCPYGQPGDRLWVKETWTGSCHIDSFHVCYAADGSERFMDSPPGYCLPKAALKPKNWVTPLFMPRWVSRITLEITEIRLLPLLSISEEDAWAEGVTVASTETATREAPLTQENFYRSAFQLLWNEINAKRCPWHTNPWVWAITFKQVPA